MPNPSTFTNCHCPHCKGSLGEIDTRTTACPLCNKPLDPDAVWLTRREPGEINLPWWGRIFTWPLLLILFGVTIFVLKFGFGWPFRPRGMFMYAAGLSLTFGVLWTVWILAWKDDE